MLTLTRIKLQMGLIAVIISYGLAFTPAYAMATEDLWQKAVQIAAENQDYAPGKVHTYVEELNRRGKVIKTEETWLQVTVDQKDQIKVECLKIMENGKDVTGREKDKREKDINNNSEKKPGKSSKRTLTFTNDDLNPFAPKVQKDVFYHPTDRKEYINGKECVLYEYTWKKNTEYTQKGTAWLAADNGAPVFLKYTLDIKPKQIKDFWATGNYQYLDGGLWQPENGEMEMSGGSWFKQFHIKVRFTLSDFWEYHQGEPSK